MDPFTAQILSVLGYAACLLAISYQCVALMATVLWRVKQPARLRKSVGPQPPVTVLKPLCGDEPKLYASLRTFCAQNYPHFQLVFGVRAAHDPALKVVNRLRREFPALTIEVVVDRRLLGTNAKVSNLANMMRVAAHDILVIADSDIIVGPNYLTHITAPLGDPRVGIVTCAYRGRAAAGFWSKLGTLYINNWFLPSVLVAQLLGFSAFAFGATIALRREALVSIGGFPVLADYLADDYMLGALTRKRGLTTVLSAYLVETVVAEPNFARLWQHELRWLRTIRTLQPWGYALSAPSHTVPLCLLGLLAGGGQPPLLLLVGLSLGMRLMLHYEVDKFSGRSERPRPWLIPIRDVLTFAAWCAGFGSRSVRWRRQWLDVQADGSVRNRAEGDSL
ncbi:MAG: bacteriohopanetetrol glucosamine biosynthesis glycosyltransferase HpnI [Nitrococcus mobilis]|nr:bacteriohopanetetrol glucosamine biosynthesis glycosyltransferase HpnI [Nitrococcus mobilis]